MSETPEIKKQTSSQWVTPAAIVIAGLLIGGGFFLNNTSSNPSSENTPSDIEVRVSDTDHVLGDPESALITIIEWSDIECPFCKRFHSVSHALYEAYEGDVALVFRHLPLDALHQNARIEAEATECVNELAGNDAFWAYLDTLYKRTESNDGLDIALLPAIAEEVAGVNQESFTTCLESGRHAETVAAQEALAEPFGIRGTPYSIFLLSDGSYYSVPGAYPGDILAITIEATLGGAPAEKNQTLIDMYTQVGQGIITPEELTAYFEAEIQPYLPETETATESTE